MIHYGAAFSVSVVLYLIFLIYIMKIEDDIAGGLFSLILGKYCDLSLFGVLPLTAQNKNFCDMSTFV